MKTIGLLGGMSWESTLGYYRAVNEGIRNTLGGLRPSQGDFVKLLLRIKPGISNFAMKIQPE